MATPARSGALDGLPELPGSIGASLEKSVKSSRIAHELLKTVFPVSLDHTRQELRVNGRPHALRETTDLAILFSGVQEIALGDVPSPAPTPATASREPPRRRIASATTWRSQATRRGRSRRLVHPGRESVYAAMRPATGGVDTAVVGVAIGT